MSTPAWRKSSHSSDGTSGQCVEIAGLSGVVGVRDSKDPEAGHLELTPNAFRKLLERAVER
ncbi:DUF397 domain-containing protein [Actinomadura sp. KC06]|uniref:DUF397 domain-containing protein n=1 Tax=Actinomadura sp. KC06 TaxID=2530369 RepID=UPI00104609AD|nr:DUF397 domain-containing protein [Actinomadura sp. KC06]TDD30542.1 DUF397 domain-containing protein [Actinomadura sp. KC06]